MSRSINFFVCFGCCWISLALAYSVVSLIPHAENGPKNSDVQYKIGDFYVAPHLKVGRAYPQIYADKLTTGEMSCPRDTADYMIQNPVKMYYYQGPDDANGNYFGGTIHQCLSKVDQISINFAGFYLACNKTPQNEPPTFCSPSKYVQMSFEVLGQAGDHEQAQCWIMACYKKGLEKAKQFGGCYLESFDRDAKQIVNPWTQNTNCPTGFSNHEITSVISYKNNCNGGSNRCNGAIKCCYNEGDMKLNGDYKKHGIRGPAGSIGHNFGDGDELFDKIWLALSDFKVKLAKLQHELAAVMEELEQARK